MRKALLVILALVGVVGVAGIAAAQDHNNMTEKKVSDQITFSTDVRVGTQLIKAGEYLVTCDTKTVKFTRLEQTYEGPGHWQKASDKPFEFVCKGKELPTKSERTELDMPPGSDGVPVLAKMYIRGSNIEHTFN